MDNNTGRKPLSPEVESWLLENGIMLVDFAIEEIAQGVDRLEAIVDAGRKRARPIIMTTLAMGAGMLPIALGLGTDPSFRAPMAIVVIGGLITSTFLSLLTPAGRVYSSCRATVVRAMFSVS